MKILLSFMFFLLFYLPSASAATSKDEFLKFFKEYDHRGKIFDASMGDMYSDDAKIHVVRKMSDGNVKRMELSGAELKQMIKDVMPYAKQMNDISTYKKIKIKVDGYKAKITASRYSNLKCYTDDSYYMIVEKSDNKMYIIEEFTESLEDSLCKTETPNRLELLLAAAAKTMNHQLPIMVDSDTRLDKTVSKGKTLQYQFTIVNYNSIELDATTLKNILQESLLKKTCSSPNLKPLLRKGATVSYAYSGKDDINMLSIDIQPGQCKK